MNKLKRLERALLQIRDIGGNLPDERFMTRTGPNDAVMRGLMYVQAREIAIGALKSLAGEPPTCCAKHHEMGYEDGGMCLGKAPEASNAPVD